MGGCANKNGVGIFGEKTKYDESSMILNLKDANTHKIPLCRDGFSATTKREHYSYGYYPTSVVSEETNGAKYLTRIDYDELKNGIRYDVTSCYLDEERGAILLKIKHTASEVEMLTRLEDMDMDFVNIARNYKQKENPEDLKK